MEKQVELPELSQEEDAPEEGEISFWYVQEGETLKEGQDLAEVITDKAAFTVPAPVGGTLKTILKDEGDKVKVGEEIAVIEQ